MKKVEDYVRSIPDFPEEGIIFRDVTSVLQDADGLQLAIDELKKKLDGVEFDVLAGTESRGFIFGMPLAYLLKNHLYWFVKQANFHAKQFPKHMTLSMAQQQSKSIRMLFSQDRR